MLFYEQHMISVYLVLMYVEAVDGIVVLLEVVS